MRGEYIEVHILDVPYHADCEYTYYVPLDFRSDIEIGSMVVVPFGRADRQKTAIVTRDDIITAPTSSAVKPIKSVLSSYLKLDSEMLELCHFMKKRTLCTVGEAVKCIVPSAIMAKTEERFYLGDCDKKIEPYLKDLYDFIAEKECVNYKKISERFGEAHQLLSRLLRMGAIRKETFVEEKDKNKYETRVKLNITKEEAINIAEGASQIRLRSEKHADILRLLVEYDELSDKQIYEMCDSQKSHIDALIKKELVSTYKVELFRDPYALLKETKEKEEIKLNDIQLDALNSLKELYFSREPRAALLFGVTGSGKTSVIKKMIDEVISDGKGVIILVPEISLTPQTVSVFCSYYQERVAVIHSSLSAGERFDTYKKIADGEANIVIGTRSAIFAPIKNLGMIVIDEEQEHTYKSDTNPKYSAHDIARFRCAKSNALMLLASATPSLESFYKAKDGTYTLVKMMSRYGQATLPDVLITDMRKEKSRGNIGPYSIKLADYLLRTKEDNRQSILFLNRRGYHSSISCQSCGEVLECPNCSVALTYHTYKKIDEELTPENAHSLIEKNGTLRCHYCGYRTRVPMKCKCGESDFNYVGFGTQKAESELQRLMPSAKSLRMDADTTTSKSSYEQILGDFRNQKADVLIGTQMVTKGHNFPLVTLVGVISADTMLYTSDFRAAERTFSMLTQVVGRAGRARDKGVAIIQTSSPNEQTIQLAAKQDYESFYENEIQIRKAYQFPPFCDIVLITMTSPNETILNSFSNDVIKSLEEEMKEEKIPAIAYGPFEAPIYKTQGKYRKRIIIKCKLNNKLREIFSKLYIKCTKGSDKNYISIDFNPSSL
ncbi:MAG: primosomal protein N' [Ruminococcaceae bacterium]|nr:primosomal protein N' [Oscillospiraceae bacterium]